MPTIKPSQRGFSLIELSVVILIIGILIYMTLAVGRQQLEIARIKQTQFKLQKIQTALTVYYKTYGHLPCPAAATAPTTNAATFGLDISYNNPTSAPYDATCSADLEDPVPYVYIGVIPVLTLGMTPDSMFDGWDNRITYIVSIPCVDPDSWISTNKYKCTYNSGNNGALIELKGKNGQKWPTPNLAAYMAISYGPSGNGAWSHNGARNGLNVASTAPAELANGNFDSSGAFLDPTNANRIYYDQTINDGNVASNYYDNITIWATPPQIYYYANH